MEAPEVITAAMAVLAAEAAVASAATPVNKERLRETRLEFAFELLLSHARKFTTEEENLLVRIAGVLLFIEREGGTMNLQKLVPLLGITAVSVEQMADVLKDMIPHYATMKPDQETTH